MKERIFCDHCGFEFTRDEQRLVSEGRCRNAYACALRYERYRKFLAELVANWKTECKTA